LLECGLHYPLQRSCQHTVLHPPPAYLRPSCCQRVSRSQSPCMVNSTQLSNQDAQESSGVDHLLLLL
jgi:hypothetical protein